MSRIAGVPVTGGARGVLKGGGPRHRRQADAFNVRIASSERCPHARMPPSDVAPLHVRPVDTDADWQQARAIRERVFVDEQNCPPEEEWDRHDATSRHVLGVVPAPDPAAPGSAAPSSAASDSAASGGETAVGTARWRAVPHDGAVVAKLERFAVLPSHRGRGYGTRLVTAVLADARRAGFRSFLLHAQAHLADWYATFGFRSTGRRFDEVGIPHVEMTMHDANPDERRP